MTGFAAAANAGSKNPGLRAGISAFVGFFDGLIPVLSDGDRRDYSFSGVSMVVTTAVMPMRTLLSGVKSTYAR